VAGLDRRPRIASSASSENSSPDASGPRRRQERSGPRTFWSVQKPDGLGQLPSQQQGSGRNRPADVDAHVRQGPGDSPRGQRSIVGRTLANPTCCSRRCCSTGTFRPGQQARNDAVTVQFVLVAVTRPAGSATVSCVTRVPASAKAIFTDGTPVGKNVSSPVWSRKRRVASGRLMPS
jgi:hypothetical protein